MSTTIWDVLKAPVITEKALFMKEDSTEPIKDSKNKKVIKRDRQLLTFRVASNATKHAIKAAVETIFKVEVEQVRVANYHGKSVRRGRTEGKSERRPAILCRRRRRPARGGLRSRDRTGHGPGFPGGTGGISCALPTRRARLRSADDSVRAGEGQWWYEDFRSPSPLLRSKHPALIAARRGPGGSPCPTRTRTTGGSTSAY